MKPLTLRKQLRNILIIVVSAILSALVIYYFLDNANFAPSGVDGIALMIQHLTDFPAEYSVLLINIPLLVIAWFILDRRFVVYTGIYIITYAFFFAFLHRVGFIHFTDNPADSAAGLIAAVFSGFFLGARTGVLLRIGASSGGIDIPAGCLQKRRPYLDVEKVITAICYVTILISFFVYGNSPMAVCLALLQMFVFERGAALPMKETRNAVEFKIITKHPETIKDEIVFHLKHGATVLDSHGMFTGDPSTVILTVVNIRQVPEFFDIIKKHPDTFVYYNDVSGVRGNFRWNRDDDVK